MPVWNVYLADLTGDGLPELCATVSLGSGIIDERIIAFDYATGNTCDLSDRMYYDYALYLDNGRLMVKQTKYPTLKVTRLRPGNWLLRAVSLPPSVLTEQDRKLTREMIENFARRSVCRRSPLLL